MSKVRAEILSPEFPNMAAARITINAPASAIFELLANPRSHQLFDGSGTIQANIEGPERLYLGATFTMKMKIRIGYKIKNTVTEFEESKRITWRHLMRWTWSYQLVEIGNGQTEVTETFDAHSVPAFSTWWIARTGAMKYNPTNIAKSLVRLKAMCEA